MARPDLTDPAQGADYRRELRALYRGWRWLGLGLVIAATILLAWPRMGGPWMLGPRPMQDWGWIALAAGWAILIAIIALRTRHHRRRMAEPPAA